MMCVSVGQVGFCYRTYMVQADEAVPEAHHLWQASIRRPNAIPLDPLSRST